MDHRVTVPIEDVVNSSAGAIAKLAAAQIWQAIFIFHFALLALVFWLFQITPHSIQAAILRTPEPALWKILSALGISVLGLAFGYWKILRWAHKKIGMRAAFRWLVALPKRT